MKKLIVIEALILAVTMLLGSNKFYALSYADLLNSNYVIEFTDKDKEMQEKEAEDGTIHQFLLNRWDTIE